MSPDAISIQMVESVDDTVVGKRPRDGKVATRRKADKEICNNQLSGPAETEFGVVECPSIEQPRLPCPKVGPGLVAGLRRKCYGNGRSVGS